jgi:hypothetical protein
MNKQEFLNKAAKQYKMAKLRSRQQALGEDIMDEVAVMLNARTTYEEEVFVKNMWSIFEKVGARMPKESK